MRRPRRDSRERATCARVVSRVVLFPMPLRRRHTSVRGSAFESVLLTALIILATPLCSSAEDADNRETLRSPALNGEPVAGPLLATVIPRGRGGVYTTRVDQMSTLLALEAEHMSLTARRCCANRNQPATIPALQERHRPIANDSGRLCLPKTSSSLCTLGIIEDLASAC